MKDVFRFASVAAAASATLATFPQTGTAACSSGQQAEAATAAVTLLVSGPLGGSSCLTYVGNDGWRLDHADNGQDVAQGQMTPVAIGGEDHSQHPLTVFIDGPTGYTYTWFPNEGWRFLGRLAERAR